MTRSRITAGLALVLLAFFIGGCDGHADEGPHVSAGEQKKLPTEAFALGDSLCPANYVKPEKLASRWRRQAVEQWRALRIALRRHPDHLVTVVFHLSDPEGGEDPIDREDLTILELAETHYGQLKGAGGKLERSVEGREPASCRVRLRDELGALIRGAGGTTASDNKPLGF